jgi:aminopeptidase YwaD
MNVTTPDPQLWSDFQALCDCGGRLAGSASEATALAWARERLGEIAGGTLTEHPVDYPGWRWRSASLTDVASGQALRCTPLLGTVAAQGLVAEVVNLGLGRSDDFARHADAIAGRIVMVRHEYPFAAGHVHRRVKLTMAQRAGAAGFLIAHPERGVGPVSGSSGRNGGPGIAALGIDADAADVLCGSGKGALPTVRVDIDGADFPAQARMLVLDLPGRGPDWIVVSAHLDGHPLGESAIDNATGVVVALALARGLASRIAPCPRGLRVCLTGAEEWGLVGSRLWLERMDARERNRMLLDINLDSVGGAANFTALTSGFANLDAFVRASAARAGLPLATYLPLMANSDHACFAAHGIPAVRLIAGFDAPDSHLRLLLTAADTRDKVMADELAAGLRIATALTWEALTASDATLKILAT